VPKSPTRSASYLNNAAHCADVAVAAYADENHPLIAHWPNRRSFQVGSEQGVVVWDEVDIVVGIAGTNDIYDLIANADVRWTQFGLFGVHAGFHSQCQIVASALAGMDLPSFGDLSRTWWITGHSAGAAKASILPLLIPELHPRKIVTFASPRCFRSSTAMLYGLPVNRFDHPNDVVPDVPLHGKYGIFRHLGGWEHVGKATYVWENGRVSNENGHRLRRIIRHVVKARSFRLSRMMGAIKADHSMQNVYWRALQPWRNRPTLTALGGVT